MQILDQFSRAFLLAVNGGRARRRSILHALRHLAELQAPPFRLTEIAYEWCSTIYENRKKIEDWESLLFVCLELGFRHLDTPLSYIDVPLTHTEHHQGLVEVVFKSQKSEVIADLLFAWTLRRNFSGPAGTLVEICTGHLVGLHMSHPDPILPEVAATCYTSHRDCRIQGIQECRGKEVHRVAGSSPCYSQRRAQGVGATPVRCGSIIRGDPMLIQMVLGITGQTRNIGPGAAETRGHRRSKHSEDPH